MTTIDFYFDFRSPYSYLAHSQLGSLGAGVNYRPMDVVAVMKQVGNTPTTVTCQAKGQYARADLQRWAKRYGLPLRPRKDRQSHRRPEAAAGRPRGGRTRRRQGSRCGHLSRILGAQLP